MHYCICSLLELGKIIKILLVQSIDEIVHCLYINESSESTSISPARFSRRIHSTCVHYEYTYINFLSIRKGGQPMTGERVSSFSRILVTKWW